MRTNRRRLDAFDARMLAAADELFREFDDVPILDVIDAINTARRVLASPGSRPDPVAIQAVARARLADSAVA